MSSEVDRIRALFTQNLKKAEFDLLEFTEKDGYVIVKPREYLSTDVFAKVARLVREAGGEYISAGKESHFRIPKLENAESQLVREAMSLLKRHVAETNELLEKFKDA